MTPILLPTTYKTPPNTSFSFFFLFKKSLFKLKRTSKTAICEGKVCYKEMCRDVRNCIVCEPAVRKQTPGGSPRERFRGGGHTVASYFGRKQASFPPLYPTDNGLLTCWTSRENRLGEEQKGQPNQWRLSLPYTL